MFVVWLGALVTASLTVDPELFGPSTANSAYNGVVTLILLLTVWFANAAEALAEGRGKAKAAALRRTKTELTAKRVQPTGEFELVPATAVRKGDLLQVEKTELIPTDGEVIEGTAYVDESAVTGEAAPVLKEPGCVEEAGRGLQMVDALSDVWGWSPMTGRGKAVWAILFCA